MGAGNGRENGSGAHGVDKQALRAKMRAVRDSLGVDGRASADAAIAAKVCANSAYLAADAVFAYLSVGAEVDTRAIIRDAWSRGKLVAVPRCVPGTNLMEWYRIDDFEGLERSSFGIDEPPADPSRLVAVPGPADPAPSAVAIVPGYSFDAQGYRLGYGGGFYDVFLPTFGGASIGLCRIAQMSEAPLPRFETDVAVDCVVTG